MSSPSHQQKQQLKRSVIFVALLINLSAFASTECLRVDDDVVGPVNSDKSGWRTVEIVGDSETAAINKSANQTNRKQQTSERDKKLIEWDDDDLNDLIQNIRDGQSRGGGHSLQHLETHFSLAPHSKLRDRLVHPHASPSSSASLLRAKSNPAKFSRLVYHGQVKQNSTTIKLRDGLKIHIDTHRPLAIHRRSKSSGAGSASSAERPAGEIRWSIESSLSPAKQQQSPSSSSELMKSSSDWKPIVMLAGGQAAAAVMRSRRSGRAPDSPKEATGAQSEVIPPKLIAAGGVKWKPIVAAGKATDEGAAELQSIRGNQSRTEAPKPQEETEVVYGNKLRPLDGGGPRMRNSRLEEPFESDDGLIVLRRDKSSPSNDSNRLQRHSKSRKDHGQQQPETSGDHKGPARKRKQADDYRWTPVSETTANPVEDLATTTAATSITTATAATNSSSSLNGSMELSAGHRSASDLNYIYSAAQPDNSFRSPPTSSGYSSSGSGYYSNYLVPAAQLVQQPPTIEQPSAIIDTTSGQTPEMIADRAPDQPPPLPVSYESSGYSLPQTSVSAFQPAQPLPPRQPVPASNYGYDHSPRAQQPSRALQPSPQVVKQEHHYHYYNQQQQQQREQRDQLQQQPERLQQLQQQPAPQQIIREIQPLFISQLMQPSTTTSTTTTPPPPQIIREIIRETPAQPQPPPQFSRLIQMPVAPQPAPLVTRDLEPPPAMAFQYQLDNPAQRIIRQLVSSGLPSVSVRLPQLPPIKMPALQLPVRLAQVAPAASAAGGSVTRQTGSFMIPPLPKKTTTYLTETQAMPTHTTIMHTTQFTPATRTTVFTTDHDTSTASRALPIPASSSSYKAK